MQYAVAKINVPGVPGGQDKVVFFAVNALELGGLYFPLGAVPKMPTVELLVGTLNASNASNSANSNPAAYQAAVLRQRAMMQQQQLPSSNGQQSLGVMPQNNINQPPSQASTFTPSFNPAMGIQSNTLAMLQAQLARMPPEQQQVIIQRMQAQAQQQAQNNALSMGLPAGQMQQQNLSFGGMGTHGMGQMGQPPQQAMGGASGLSLSPELLKNFAQRNAQQNNWPGGPTF